MRPFTGPWRSYHYGYENYDEFLSSESWFIFPGDTDSSEVVLLLGNGALPQSVIQNWIIGTAENESRPWIVIAKSEESFNRVLKYFEYCEEHDYSEEELEHREEIESQIPVNTHELTAVMTGSHDQPSFAMLGKDFPSSYRGSEFPKLKADEKNNDIENIWHEFMEGLDGLEGDFDISEEPDWEFLEVNNFDQITLGLDDFFTTEAWEHIIEANVMRVMLRPRDAWVAPPGMIKELASGISRGRREAFLHSRNQPNQDHN